MVWCGYCARFHNGRKDKAKCKHKEYWQKRCLIPVQEREDMVKSTNKEEKRRIVREKERRRNKNKFTSKNSGKKKKKKLNKEIV